MAVEVTFLPGTNTNNIDTNFQRVKDALADVVGRSGDLPNQMEADLDLNSNDILNAGIGNFENIIVDGDDIHDVVGSKGWSPIFAGVLRDTDIVMQLVDYVGGGGNKPTEDIGKYVGSTGYVTDINDAVVFSASGGIADGDKGDITVSGVGSTWTINNDSITNDKVDANAAIAGTKLDYDDSAGYFIAANIQQALDKLASVEYLPTLIVGSGNATANTTAINNAIQTANTLGGGIVRIPVGTYHVDQILMRPKVQLVGQNRGASELTNIGANSTSVITANDNTVSNLWMGVSHLKISKPNATGGTIIDMTSWQFSRVFANWITSKAILGTSCIWMKGLFTAGPVFTTEGTYNLVDHNYMGLCAFGVRLGPNANTCWLLHNRVQPGVTGGFGFYLGTTGAGETAQTGYPNQVVLDSNSVEFPGGLGVTGVRGIFLEAVCDDILIVNNRFEGGALSDAIYVTAGAVGFASGNHYSGITGLRTNGISSKFQTLDASEGKARLVPIAKIGIIGTTGAKIGDAHNLSASRTGTGQYTFTFGTAMDVSTYDISPPAIVASTNLFAVIRTKTTAGFTVEVLTVGTTPALADPLQLYVKVWP